MPLRDLPSENGHLPTVDVEDSLEALLAENHTAIRGLYLVALALLCTSLGAAATVPVDVDVRAPATLRPARERETLRAPVDGVVATVAAARGQTVHVGDTLIRFRATPTDRAIEAAVIETREQQRAVRDLRTILRVGLIGDSLAAPLAGLTALATRATWSEAEVEWRQLTEDVERVRQTVTRTRQLASRGFAAPTELASAELELARAQTDRALAVEHRRATWSRQLIDAERRLRDLHQIVAATTADRADRVIVAPIGGTIEELAAVSSASIVRAGDVMATISPETTLVAEALLSPRDVGWIRPGMPVRLVIDGYGVQEWGAARASVTSVGRDYSLVDGRPSFRVRARLLQEELRRPGGSRATLTKGLRGEARFVIDRRTIGQLVMRRSREWIDGPHGSEAPSH